MKRPEKTVCLIFTLIGLGMMIGSYFLYKHQRDFLATASYAEGTVTEHFRVSDSDDGDTYAPVVAFTTAQGAAVEFTSTVSSNPPSFVIGEKVEVAYQENNPLDAQINSFGSLYLGVIILGGMGVFFIGLSTLAMHLVGKSDASMDQKVEEMRAKMHQMQAQNQTQVQPQETLINRDSDWPDGGGPGSTVQRG